MKTYPNTPAGAIARQVQTLEDAIRLLTNWRNYAGQLCPPDSDWTDVGECAQAADVAAGVVAALGIDHQTAAARAPRGTKGKPCTPAQLAARRANTAKATIAKKSRKPNTGKT